MNAEIKRCIIWEMNEVINRYVEECGLFYGGCCYAAYVLARYLSKLGIDYNTTIFQYNDILNCRKFKAAINGRGVCHVAIRVMIDGQETYIGDLYSTYKFFEITDIPYKVRHYRVTPMMILKGYWNGLHRDAWNCMYDTDNNSSLSRDIKRIYLKYADKI